MTRRHSAPAAPQDADDADAWGLDAGAGRQAPWARLSGQPAAAAGEPGPERLYVLTGGRGGPSGSTRLDLVTLVVAVGGERLGPVPQRRGLFPEHAAILRLCRYPLSAAELSAHLRLPFSATAVLVDDLLSAGLVAARSPRHASVPDPDLIREVLRGLEGL
jgi:hypothetical protein